MDSNKAFKSYNKSKRSDSPLLSRTSWSHADDMLLAEAYECGMSDEELGHLIGRSAKSISVRRSKIVSRSLKRFSPKARKILLASRSERTEAYMKGKSIQYKENRLSQHTHAQTPNVTSSTAAIVSSKSRKKPAKGTRHRSKSTPAPYIVHQNDVARIAAEIQDLKNESQNLTSMLNLLLPYLAGVTSAVAVWALVEVFYG